VGYRWTDEGEYERLVVLFGSRAVEIEGHNLKALVDQIREGQLNGVRELITAQAELKRANAESEPVISSVKTYPDFEELLKEIKGGDEHDTGFARKARGR
jgi:ketol-acid reductoisomerase